MHDEFFSRFRENDAAETNNGSTMNFLDFLLKSLLNDDVLNVLECFHLNDVLDFQSFQFSIPNIEKNSPNEKLK